jgi:hypothetical protein
MTETETKKEEKAAVTQQPSHVIADVFTVGRDATKQPPAPGKEEEGEGDDSKKEVDDKEEEEKKTNQ